MRLMPFLRTISARKYLPPIIRVEIHLCKGLKNEIEDGVSNFHLQTSLYRNQKLRVNYFTITYLCKSMSFRKVVLFTTLRDFIFVYIA